MFSPFFSPPIWIIWALFMVGTIPTNRLIARIRSVVLSKGLGFAPWTPAWVAGLRNFHRVIAEEQDPTTRLEYRRLALRFYICFAWCLVLFIAFGVVVFRVLLAT